MYLNILSQLFEYVISPYLTVSDCYNYYTAFAITNSRKFFSKFIANRVLNNFEPELKKYIATLLQSTNGVLSGSSIIQEIVGERWAKSDIDIYISHTEQNNIMLNNFIVQRRANNPYKIIINDIVCVKQIYKFHTNIQVIILNVPVNKIISFIDRVFDYSFCKGAVMFKDNKWKSSFYDLHDVVNKCCVFDMNFLNKISIGKLAKLYNRYNKYTIRGFKIDIIKRKIIMPAHFRCLKNKCNINCFFSKMLLHHHHSCTKCHQIYSSICDCKFKCICKKTYSYMYIDIIGDIVCDDKIKVVDNKTVQLKDKVVINHF